MVLGITALGESRTSGLHKIGVWVSHMAGGIFGGVSTGIVAIFLGTPVRLVLGFQPRVALCSVVLVAVILVDLGLIRHRSGRRQVPATWARRYGWRRAYFFYGVLLGSGLATYVATAATYAVFAVSVLALTPGAALGCGAAFGLGRTFIAGVGSLLAENASRFLYRSSASHVIAPFASAVITGLLLASVIGFAV
jgi:hypothetical protein